MVDPKALKPGDRLLYPYPAGSPGGCGVHVLEFVAVSAPRQFDTGVRLSCRRVVPPGTSMALRYSPDELFLPADAAAAHHVLADIARSTEYDLRAQADAWYARREFWERGLPYEPPADRTDSA